MIKKKCNFSGLTTANSYCLYRPLAYTIIINLAITQGFVVSILNNTSLGDTQRNIF